MILQDYLKQNKGQRVKIGSIKGSSFFYCDTIGENTEKEIENIGNSFKKHYKDSANTKYTAYKNSIIEKDKKNNLKLYRRYMKLYNGFTSLLTREVIEVYDSISYDELDAKIVMVKGKEIGKYWTIKEFVNEKEEEKEKLRKQAEEIKRKILEDKAKRIAEEKVRNEGAFGEWHIKD